MAKKPKNAWFCPLCLRWGDQPTNEKKYRRYELSERLMEILEEIFRENFYEHHRDPNEED